MGHPVAGLFDRQFNTLANALSARERMQGVYSANIANADTPNYRADTRTFADFLAARQEAGGNGAALATTRPGHIRDNADPSWQEPPLTRAAQAQRMDGNTVDMQKEMAGMAENQLMHDMTLRIVKKRLDLMSTTIREAGK